MFLVVFPVFVFCRFLVVFVFYWPGLGPLEEDGKDGKDGEDGGGRGPLWMVFDGALDLSWSEYLHAVLDESTAFPIPNSVERLPLREENLLNN